MRTAKEKSKAWYYRFHGAPYAYGPARFDNPVSEKKARENIKKTWELKRWPYNMEIWPTND
jgi:hypothetical protein